MLDANVLASSLLSQKIWPAKILDLIMDDYIQVAYDDRIFGEYEEVLARPELHIDPPRVLAVHHQPLLKQNALVLSPAQFMAKFFPGQE